MQETELIVFNKNEISELISELNVKIRREKGKTYVLNDEGEIRCCAVCKRKLEVGKIGSIAHGSVDIFCDIVYY